MNYNERLVAVRKAISLNNFDKASLLLKGFDDDQLNTSEILAYRGLVAQKFNKLNDSLNFFLKSLELSKPSVSIDLLLSIGDTYSLLGLSKDAEKFYSQVLSFKPNHILTILKLANLFFKNEKFNNAKEYYQLIYDLDNTEYNILYNIGLCERRLKKYDDAIFTFEKFIDTQDKFDIASDVLGAAYFELGLAYSKSISLSTPDNRLINDDNIYKSRECLITANKLKKNDPLILHNLGVIHYHINDIDNALKFTLEAYEINPDYIANTYNYCFLLLAEGRGGLAEEIIENFVSKDPSATIFIPLGSKVTFSPKSNFYKWVLNLFESTDDIDTKINCGFSIFNILDNAKHYEKAFSYLNEANKLYNSKNPFLKNKLIEQHQFAQKAFSSVKGIKLEYSYKNYNNIRPIFIIGMPRSGTSLAEQILDSHHNVYGAGELLVINELVKEYQDNYNAGISNFDNFQSLSKKYFQIMKRYNKDNKPVIIDKMPGNYLWVGFIKKIIPDALFIHCKRDYMDTCLSIYSKNFIGAFNSYYDLKDIGFVYLAYSKLMKHWYDEFGKDSIFDLNYEDLIANSEKVIKDLLDFSNLDFDKNCLNFYENKRMVRTASSLQVREKINSKAVERWKNYERNLKPLKEYVEKGILD